MSLSLSLISQSRSSLVLKQIELKARCKTNHLCLSPTHLSLFLSTASHFFFTRSGGQWVGDYIYSSFFFLDKSSGLICRVRDLGLEDRQTNVRFSKPGGLTTVQEVHRKTDISGFVTLKNCFDEWFTVNPVEPYSLVRV